MGSCSLLGRSHAAQGFNLPQSPHPAGMPLENPTAYTLSRPQGCALCPHLPSSCVPSLGNGPLQHSHKNPRPRLSCHVHSLGQTCCPTALPRLRPLASPVWTLISAPQMQLPRQAEGPLLRIPPEPLLSPQLLGPPVALQVSSGFSPSLVLHCPLASSLNPCSPESPLLPSL